MGPPKGSAGWTAGENQDRAPHSGSTDQQYAVQDFGSNIFNRQTLQDTYADDLAARHPNESQDHEEGGADGPTKLDKIRGNLLITKGKLTHGTHEMEQGRMLKETGKHVDVGQEMREGKFDDTLKRMEARGEHVDSPASGRGIDSQY